MRGWYNPRQTRGTKLGGGEDPPAEKLQEDSIPDRSSAQTHHLGFERMPSKGITIESSPGIRQHLVGWSEKELVAVIDPTRH
ncbi:hypothetical protein AXG93_4485s1240 [Marchantia polymorpha subsp. ruderalis]|uniref:Uncharacterized protein n=1 Tax=Marchantia polymorpha subsp. ruderalis TaxID=1480154 RepID=A0A176WFP1_MARPO|nr:hypothetical protein AXG93_4485s1240 [Marchantia polymorpha subsp. ruderalis]